MNKLIPTAAVLLTLAGCTGLDLEGAVLQEFATHGPACIPPTASSDIELYAFDDSVFDLQAVLYSAATEDGTQGDPLRAPGIPVSLRNSTGTMVLDEATTDVDGRVSFTLDAGQLDDFDLAIAVDGQEPIQFPYNVTVPRTGLGGDLLCAYWADDAGQQLTTARQGDTVHLVVHGEGGIEPPTLVIEEAGNDLGGNQRAARFEASAFEDGRSTNAWTVDATGGFFEGRGLELEFRAAMVVNAAGDAAYTRSTWLHTN